MSLSVKLSFMCVWSGECHKSGSTVRFGVLKFMSPQMTLTADGLILHKICAIYDIEMILGPNLPNLQYKKSILSN